MKKIIRVLLSLVILSLVLIVLFNKSSETDSPTSQPPKEVEQEQVKQGNSAGSTVDDETIFTSDEFGQLSRQEQDEMMDEYLLDFWAKELGLTEPNAEGQNLSLEIFNRPYMYTLTEKEFFRLSKEDQEKAIAEITDNCRQVRSYVMDLKAEAEKCMNNKDYKNAEAYYVHCLQTGRELSVDKDGLLISRLVGIACEKAGLNGLVRLYEKTGENSNLQMAREQLSEIDREVEEIKRTAKESEANS
jgi:hypothetical protein